MIETLNDKTIQSELVDLQFAKFQDFNSNDNIIQQFIILKNSKVRNYLLPLFQKYMMDRKLDIKGLSKPIQLKMEKFLSTFNSIYLSSKKSHNYKITNKNTSGSYETDSSIKIIKKKLRKK
jgi:hypothetical protein